MNGHGYLVQVAGCLTFITASQDAYLTWQKLRYACEQCGNIYLPTPVRGNIISPTICLKEERVVPNGWILVAKTVACRGFSTINLTQEFHSFFLLTNNGGFCFSYVKILSFIAMYLFSFLAPKHSH